MQISPDCEFVTGHFICNGRGLWLYEDTILITLPYLSHSFSSFTFLTSSKLHPDIRQAIVRKRRAGAVGEANDPGTESVQWPGLSEVTTQTLFPSVRCPWLASHENFPHTALLQMTWAMSRSELHHLFCSLLSVPFARGAWERKGYAYMNQRMMSVRCNRFSGASRSYPHALWWTQQNILACARVGLEVTGWGGCREKRTHKKRNQHRQICSEYPVLSSNPFPLFYLYLFLRSVFHLPKQCVLPFSLFHDSFSRYLSFYCTFTKAGPAPLNIFLFLLWPSVSLTQTVPLFSPFPAFWLISLALMNTIGFFFYSSPSAKTPTIKAPYIN